MTRRETGRQKWVRETRESVHRALRSEFVASAGYLEGSLDVGGYSTGFGFYGQRSAREIAAALRWLEAQGFARRTGEKDEVYGGDLFELTEVGVEKLPAKGRQFPERYPES